MATSRIIWNGKPGEVYANNTERFKYQLIVAYSNSCGFCIQYDRAVSNWWPLPFHVRCRCRQLLVKPGGRSEPFVDFREKLANLSDVQKTSAIGRSNYSLLQRGVVSWDDIVTETRVRSFTEVSQRAKLDIAAMERAGVRSDHAKHAFDRIHTPKQELIREQRQKLIANIQAAGLSDTQIKEAISAGVGEKIGIVGGNTTKAAARTVTQASSRLARLPGDLRDVLAYYGRKVLNLFAMPRTSAVEGAEAAPKTRARKATPKPAPEPGRFATHDEVEAWAKEKFPKAHTIKVDGIPLESWHLIADEVDHLAGKFPGVAQQIQNFGADNAAETANPGAIAWVSMGGGTLKFDRKYWGKLNKLTKIVDESVQTGWIPAKTQHAGPKYYVTHEWGHLVDSHLQRTDRDKYLSLHKQFKNEGSLNFVPSKGALISEYGATSETEAMAESFAAARWRTDHENPIVNKFREDLGL